MVFYDLAYFLEVDLFAQAVENRSATKVNQVSMESGVRDSGISCAAVVWDFSAVVRQTCADAA